MDLFLSLERKFKAASDKEVSKQQEAYLRHHFKCYGIKSPERRMLYKELIKAAKRQAKLIGNCLINVGKVTIVNIIILYLIIY